MSVEATDFDFDLFEEEDTQDAPEPVELNETQEKMVDISAGVIGALTLLVDLYQMGATSIIDYLHTKPELWGSALWILYKDENGENLLGFTASLITMMVKDGALVL
jgi:hypothetical protein